MSSTTRRMVSVNASRIISIRKPPPNGNTRALLAMSLGYLVVSSAVMACWYLSAVRPLSSVEDWCSSLECQERLEALRSKLELEDQLFEEQRLDLLDKGSKKQPKPYRRNGIIKERLFEMFEGDGVSSKPQYRPRPEWKIREDGTGGSFPTLNVVGQIKTGTSQLYNLFHTHKDVLSIPEDEKEHCAYDHHDEETPDQDTYEYTMYQWHAHYYQQKASSRHQHQVNGCLNLADLERRYAYNPPARHTKFFVLLRDPADWAWAAYNFFCDRTSEDFEPDDNWVNASLHYRSPEAFHETILSGGKLKGSEFVLGRLRDNSIWTLRRLRALVGDENLVVLKNEDLQPHRIRESGTLARLAQTTGLSLEGFDEKTLGSRSNCNANKGYSETCQEEDRRPQGGVGYPVTAGRPMLESTRKFLYAQWHETCQAWKEEFGVVYEGCLSALP